MTPIHFLHERGENILEMTQWIPRPVGEVFHFFSLEKNLEELTPPFLHFHVVGKSSAEIEEGTLIDYRLRMHGVPMKWRTRIESWNPGIQFVDTQLKGPYALWHHTHLFVERDGGTLMTDRVRYRLPLGVFGEWGVGSFVKRDLRRIFQYRSEKIEMLFPVISKT